MAFMRTMLTFVLVAIVLLPGAAANATAPAALSPQEPVKDFSLHDFRGRRHSLSEYEDRTAVVIAFLGTECPLAKLYAPRLERLHQEFHPKGAAFLGINANLQDSITEIAAYVRRHNVTFPMLKDVTHEVADLLEAQRTPEVIVLDRNRRIAYRGRIDDQYGVGVAKDKPTTEDLRDALEDVLAGRPVQKPITEPVGCFIGRKRTPNEDSPVTYSNQISRIFQTHCVECHRPGEIAPFSLTDYDEVAGWAETALEVVHEQRMPPWHANPEHGSFSNARLMTTQEKELIAEWVRQGAPEGDPSELPPPREFVTGWRLPEEPHQAVPMSDRPFTVPAEGIVEYQYFAVDPKFSEDKWVRATDLVPSNRAVVHHAIVFVSPPADRPGRGLGWLAAYVPGQSSMSLPEGQARLVPAGSKFIFQMHYTPNGSEQQDLTTLGLVFADAQEVKEEVATYIAAHGKFEIPPYAEDFRVAINYGGLPPGGKLIALAPHMHVRGKSFRFTINRPDRDSEILLDIPRYDFNWQNAYALAEPLPITEGMKVECVAHYDNSEGNLANPDPSATVRWGDQTFEEMMVAFFEVALPVGYQPPAKENLASAESLEKQQREAEKIARELIARFDQNGDGVISRKEVPDTFRTFGFRRFDVDRDGVITYEEAYESALQSVRRRP